MWIIWFINLGAFLSELCLEATFLVAPKDSPEMNTPLLIVDFVSIFQVLSYAANSSLKLKHTKTENLIVKNKVSYIFQTLLIYILIQHSCESIDSINLGVVPSELCLEATFLVAPKDRPERNTPLLICRFCLHFSRFFPWKQTEASTQAHKNWKLHCEKSG